MATFTISQDRNFHDAFFAGRTGNDVYNVSYGATLTIDGDTRYGPNTSPTTGPIGTSGNTGTVLIDARAVRLIPYAGGSGNVPAADTVISQGGASGKLLGVWSSLTTTPTAAGAAMPPSGYIKVRQATGSYSAGTLAGIAANAAGTDVAGWIEIAGAPDGGWRCAGLYSSWTVRGAWFELGVTNGVAQAFQAPCSVTNTPYGGVFIETAPGTDIFEFWPAVGVIGNAATDERGKVSFVDASGFIRIGNNGSAAAGFIPESGRRVVVPNVLFTNTTSANYAANVALDPTTARFNLVKSGSSSFGAIDVEYAVFAAYLNPVVAPKSTRAYRCAFVDYFHPGPGNLEGIIFEEGGVGSSGSSVAISTSAISFGAAGSGGPVTLKNIVAYAQSVSGASVFGIWAGVHTGIKIINSRFILGSRSPSTGQFAISHYSGQGSDVDVDGLEVIGCAINFGATLDCKLKNIKYADRFMGTVDASVPLTAIVGGTGLMVDGLSWVTETPNTCHPYNAVVAHRGGVKVRNIGSSVAPLSLGSVNKTGTFLVDSGSARKFGQIARVFTTGNRSGTAIPHGSVPMTVQNSQIDSAAVPASNVASLTYRNFRSSFSSISGYYTPGLQFLDQFLTDTEGEVIFTGAVNIGDSRFGNVLSLFDGTYADGGGILNFVAGSSVVYETPWPIKGHTGFKNVTQCVLAGGSAPGGVTFEYDIDKGLGYSGVWKAATGANMASETGIDPAVGFMLKVRGYSSAGAYMRAIKLSTTSTLVAQGAYQWPLDPVTITVNNLATGSIVKVTRTDTDAVLFTGNESGGQISFTADYSGQILVEARKASGTPYYQPWTALATVNGDITVTAVQIRDDQ